MPNKFSGDLKEAILAGVNGSNEQGVAGFVLDLSLDTPTAAAALLGRLIPVSMAGALGATLWCSRAGGRLGPSAADPSVMRFWWRIEPGAVVRQNHGVVEV